MTKIPFKIKIEFKSNIFLKGLKHIMGKEVVMGKFGGPMMYGGGFSVEGIIITALHLVFWLIIFMVAVKLVKHYFPQIPWRSCSKDGALEILRERYAKGEIDTEEFSKRKIELEK